MGPKEAIALIYSCLLALVLLILIATTIRAAKRKACPYCAESILAVARKCKHCGSMLDGSEDTQKVMVTAVDPSAQLRAPVAGKRKGKITFIGYLGIVLGFSFMVAACVLPDLNIGDKVGFFALGAALAVACFLGARKHR
jgi:hypothetical protein